MCTAEKFISAAGIITYIIICAFLFSFVYSAISFLITMAACLMIGAMGMMMFELP